jgi:hypothetical protein
MRLQLKRAGFWALQFIRRNSNRLSADGFMRRCTSLLTGFKMITDRASKAKGYRNAAAYVELMSCMKSTIFNLLGVSWN